MSKKLFYILLTCFLVSLSWNIFEFWHHRDRDKLLSELKNSQSLRKEYNLLSIQAIDGNLEREDNLEKYVLHFADLKYSIEDKLVYLHPDQKVGIYIQNINTGAWLGINERENFIPASLLKVPIAMGIYKKIETGDLNIDDELVVEDVDIDGGAGVVERFAAGQSYTVRELLEMMLSLSDNTAKNILKRNLKPEELNIVFTHVGISNPYIEQNDNQYVNPRQYERLFKALYYSTFLKAENSQAILNYLTDTRAESLLAAKLPWNIQVAHKYGERLDALHDCGIVYHPKNPYFICVMTSKIEITKAKELINDISRQVYDYIDK